MAWPSGRHGGVRTDLFSDEFLRRLTTAERERFEWRPVRRAAGAPRKFFEFIPLRIDAPLVALKAVDTTLWRCEACGATNLPYYSFYPEPPMWYVSGG
jgi:hypothetical protein